MSGDTHSSHCLWLMLVASFPHNSFGQVDGGGAGHSRTWLPAEALPAGGDTVAIRAKRRAVHRAFVTGHVLAEG